MIAMILAAGRGERLRPVTDSVPKALVEVAGVSLLERHLSMLSDAGATTVVINLGWLGEKIVDRVGSGRKYGVNVVYSPEYDNVLETGGGIHRALPMLGKDPFWVVNGDVFTDFRIGCSSSDHLLSTENLAHLILVPKPEHKQLGDFDLSDGRVANSAQPSLTFSGIALYRPEFFAGCAEGRFPLAPMLRKSAGEGRISGEHYAGRWEDVGTPERLAKLNASVSR